MISIIIPTYNSGETLIKALASVYKNNFNDFEVIVVDDASNDNTHELVKNYPVRCLLLKSNNGAAFARNRGAELAKGEILLFLDADVEVEEDLLSKINELFKVSDYDAISGVFAKESKKGNVFEYFASTLGHYGFSKTNFVFSSHLAAVKRNVFEDLRGFNECYKGATVEDDEFSHRLIASGYKGKTDMSIIAYHNHIFTFYSLFRRWFIFGLLKTPIMLQYGDSLNIRNQKQRYLVNSFYILSNILISLLLFVIPLVFYFHYWSILLIWLALYFLVKSEYLSSLRKRRLQIFVLLFITDIVVLTGCLIGATKYYYGKYVSKNYK